jgi:hypothetical protein
MTIVSSTPSRSRTVTSARGLLSLRCCAFDRQLLAVIIAPRLAVDRHGRNLQAKQRSISQGRAGQNGRFTASCVGTAIAEIQTEALPAGVALSSMTRHQTFLYRSLRVRSVRRFAGRLRSGAAEFLQLRPSQPLLPVLLQRGLSLIKRCYNARNAHFARPAEHAIERPKKFRPPRALPLVNTAYAQVTAHEVIIRGVLWSLEIPHQGKWHRASLSRSPDLNLWRGCGFPCHCPGSVALERSAEGCLDVLEAGAIPQSRHRKHR